MKKIIVVLSIIVMMFSLVACQEEGIESLTVAVSIVPQETFVKAVAGELVDVVVLIPPGNSPANYQPSPKEMAAFNESAIYFHIDVAAESHILESVNGDILLVDLAHHVDEVYPARYFDAEDHDDEDKDDHEEGHDHDHSGRDPHIWMSPSRVIVMIETIEDELSKIDPSNADVYKKNAEAYIAELNAVNEELSNAFDKMENKAFIMYHPSLGYMADDFGLEMHAIEASGKKATIQELEHVIEIARDEKIKYVFYQEEFDSQQAEIVAEEIGGATIKVAPLSGDYIENIKSIAKAMEEVMN